MVIHTPLSLQRGKIVVNFRKWFFGWGRREKNYFHVDSYGLGLSWSFYLRLRWREVPLAGTFFGVTRTNEKYGWDDICGWDTVSEKHKELSPYVLKKNCYTMAGTISWLCQKFVTIVFTPNQNETYSLQHEDNPKHVLFNPTCDSLFFTSCH